MPHENLQKWNSKWRQNIVKEETPGKDFRSWQHLKGSGSDLIRKQHKKKEGKEREEKRRRIRRRAEWRDMGPDSLLHGGERKNRSLSGRGRKKGNEIKRKKLCVEGLPGRGDSGQVNTSLSRARWPSKVKRGAAGVRTGWSLNGGGYLAGVKR